MKLVFNDKFLKSVKTLPEEHQEKLAELLESFAKNPYHPKLHTKNLSWPLTGTLSFRITRDYHVLCTFLSHDVVHLLTVKHRKDVYR